jgi:hypothetical protein
VLRAANIAARILLGPAVARILLGPDQVLRVLVVLRKHLVTPDGTLFLAETLRDVGLGHDLPMDTEDAVVDGGTADRYAARTGSSGRSSGNLSWRSAPADGSGDGFADAGFADDIISHLGALLGRQSLHDFGWLTRLECCNLRTFGLELSFELLLVELQVADFCRIVPDSVACTDAQQQAQNANADHQPDQETLAFFIFIARVRGSGRADRRLSGHVFLLGKKRLSMFTNLCEHYKCKYII